jgi:hypothetical protein
MSRGADEERSGRTRKVAVTTPSSVSYEHAQANSFAPDNTAITLQPTKTHLWDFAHTDLTTYSGVHGSLLGPWTTTKLVDTLDGTPTGIVVMYASGLANHGHDFSTWLNPAS